ncbi:hypothetical protein ACFORO_12670 [Amycolatopsis halotolerans]|uniref:Uncharacterized protein n=1 Tax=Amycolatopsis halotolerans TaxID=330083 RepID=A0ABV7QGL7_9PSEU
MNQDLGTDDAETTEDRPVLVEPGPDASPDEWVRYVNQKYPRHGVTDPGSHMGRQ